MNWLSNAFSPNMCFIPNVTITQKELTLDEFREQSKGAFSCIGHKDFAERLSKELGRKVEYNRTNISIQPDSTLFCACINGKRLQKGEYRVPKNAKIKYYRMDFKQGDL